MGIELCTLCQKHIKFYRWAIMQLFIFGLNMFLVPINMSTFRFNPSKKFLQLLVPIKNFISTFGPSFKVGPPNILLRYGDPPKRV